jgi:hypothetical protein
MSLINYFFSNKFNKKKKLFYIIIIYEYLYIRWINYTNYNNGRMADIIKNNFI